MKDKKIVNATTVHHIVTTEESKDDWLNEDNLIPLCSSCHQRTHYQYSKDEHSKIQMQKILMELKGRFIEEYN
jgi:5-methylcytosine-specific restriction endonuclease McrA